MVVILVVALLGLCTAGTQQAAVVLLEASTTAAALSACSDCFDQYAKNLYLQQLGHRLYSTVCSSWWPLVTFIA
jgi:hypothetical protein